MHFSSQNSPQHLDLKANTWKYWSIEDTDTNNVLNCMMITAPNCTINMMVTEDDHK